MNVSSSTNTNLEIKNTHQPQLKSTGFSNLQKSTITALFVASAALLGITLSATAGSFVATVICASVFSAAIAVIVGAIILSKRVNNSLKPEIADPNNLPKPDKQQDNTLSPEVAMPVNPNEKPLPLLSLPKEVLSNICTFLPINTVGHLAQVNNQFADILGSDTVDGQYNWKLIGDKLDLPIISPSDHSPKEQIKTNVYEFPEATLDLNAKRLVMKVSESDDDKYFEDIFIKCVPNGYYLKEYIGQAVFRVIYRKDDKIQTLFTPGGKGWAPGEFELFKSITETNKYLRLVPLKK